MPVWKQLTLGQITCIHIDTSKNACQNKSNTVLVSQTQYPADQPGKKGDTVQP